MKKMDRIINKIKIAAVHKKNLINLQVNKKEINLIKILLKLNLIVFSKKLKENFFLIKINNNFNLKIKSLLKKKKMTIKKNEKRFEKKIIILSNDLGLNLWKNDKGGVALWLISF